MALKQRNQRVNVDHFSMVPRADIPRSTFTTEHTHKTTFDGGWLVPIHVEEVLPGDAIRGDFTLFARMATLLFPLMDHVCIESFAFFMPSRLLWTKWNKFMGERDNPADSISFTIPQVTLTVSGELPCSIYDYMGVPPAGQISAGAIANINALPFRAYNQIWNAWFRDENIQNQVLNNLGDGPDAAVDYVLLRRNKRHDYFTSALPWPIKNATAVNLPISGSAPVLGIGIPNTITPNGSITNVVETGGTGPTSYSNYYNTSSGLAIRTFGASAGAAPAVYADLSQATGAAISALRLAVQTQRFLERDARSGTRYTELLRAHFGVTPEDVRLQRPEYIGGGKTDVDTQAIPQTSATEVAQTPLGALAGQATAAGNHRFSYNASEHGYILILLHADAELTYQQGLHRMFTRTSRFDFYWPVFAHLSEQAIQMGEIYYLGVPGLDNLTFGYQERWAEYRHRPSRISGLFRSTSTGTIDPWHAAQKFTVAPTLNNTFLQSNPPFARNLAAGAGATNLTFIADILFRINTTRAMPMYSVPGGMDRF